MIFIGITGGIGSGKSLVCSLFAKKGIPVFQSDEVAKEISDRPDVKKEILLAFGETILTKNRSIDTKKLASIVFSEHDKLLLLNSIIHPRVFSAFDHWKEKLSKSHRYAIAEAALFFETGMSERVDYVVSILADEDIRIKRVAERDRADIDAVKSRMKHQLPSQELIERSDFVLYNNGTTKELQSKIDFFHILFSSLAQRKKIL